MRVRVFDGPTGPITGGLGRHPRHGERILSQKTVIIGMMTAEIVTDDG